MDAISSELVLPLVPKLVDLSISAKVIDGDVVLSHVTSLERLSIHGPFADETICRLLDQAPSVRSVDLKGMFVYVGISSLFLRRVGWLTSGLSLVVFCGLCAGAWAIVAPKVCPPRNKQFDGAVQGLSATSSGATKTNQEQNTNRPIERNEGTNAIEK